jgi:hypothetical protein
MGKPDDQMLNRGARTYLAHAVKAATHPVRREILKSLKKGPQSTVDLEGLQDFSANRMGSRLHRMSQVSPGSTIEHLIIRFSHYSSSFLNSFKLTDFSYITFPIKAELE